MSPTVTLRQQGSAPEDTSYPARVASVNVCIHSSDVACGTSGIFLSAHRLSTRTQWALASSLFTVEARKWRAKLSVFGLEKIQFRSFTLSNGDVDGDASVRFISSD